MIMKILSKKKFAIQSFYAWFESLLQLVRLVSNQFEINMIEFSAFEDIF